jgi:hypothetical protein
VQLSRSSITGNVARRRGGGILNVDGAIVLWRSSVTGNRAGRRGGGILNGKEGSVEIQASHVAGNTPDDCFGTPAC